MSIAIAWSTALWLPEFRPWNTTYTTADIYLRVENDN